MGKLNYEEKLKRGIALAERQERVLIKILSGKNYGGILIPYPNEEAFQLTIRDFNLKACFWDLDCSFAKRTEAQKWKDFFEKTREEQRKYDFALKYVRGISLFVDFSDELKNQGGFLIYGDVNNSLSRIFFISSGDEIHGQSGLAKRQKFSFWFKFKFEKEKKEAENLLEEIYEIVISAGWKHSVNDSLFPDLLSFEDNKVERLACFFEGKKIVNFSFEELKEIHDLFLVCQKRVFGKDLEFNTWGF